MCSQTWIMSIIALLVMDVRTGAHKQDIVPRRCNQCSPTNGTTCDQVQGWVTATCPSARPYCATLAAAPDFTTSLGCAAVTDSACSLTLSPRQTLELTCICAGQLCNAPFSTKLRNELLNFSSPNLDGHALTEAFFKLSNFANVSECALYKTITVDATPTKTPVRNSSEVISSSSVPATKPREQVNQAPPAEAMPRAEALTHPEAMPRAEAMTRPEAMPHSEPLKQQATVPSDDDEDENEGSGVDEDSRSHIHSHTASAPAAPSSYLPADENKAVHLTPNLLFQSLLLFYSLV